jgi:hypothetical protein
MAIGFRPRPEPPPAPEHEVWTLRLRDRTATARMRVLPHGYELRISVDGSLILRQLRRDAELPLLQQEAAEHRAAFLAKSWQE